MAADKKVVNAKSYEDIGKEATEFISKGYPSGGTFKIASETKTPDGVNLKASATRSLDYAKGAYTEKLAAEFEPKWECKEHNVEVNGKLAVSGDFEGGVSVSNVGTKGSKVAVTGFQSDKDGAAVKGQVSFVNEQVNVKGGAKFPFKHNTHVNYNGEVAVHHGDIFVGADIRFDQGIAAPATPGSDAKPAKPDDRILYNVKVGYLTKDLQVVGAIEDQVNRDKASKFPIFHLFNLNFLYNLNESTKFGFGASVERQNAKGVELAAGAEYKVDKDTSIKGKFSVVNAPVADDREFRLGVAVKQQVSSRVNVTVGADLNARALLGTPGKPAASTPGTTKPHSFGFEVKFQ